MPICVFSQTSYPKRILWENDTVVAITKPQLIKLNRSLNDYIHLKMINKNLRMDLSASDSLCFHWKNVALKSDSVIAAEEKKFAEAMVINSELSEAIKRDKVRNMKRCIGVGVGGTLLGILLGVLFAK